jgi:hypothetical protein
MKVLYVVLYSVAAALFAVAIVLPCPLRVNLVAAGLLFWVLVDLIRQADHLSG